MNVIFLDLDGVIATSPLINEEVRKEEEKRIAILADICKEYNCKVVIEASSKEVITPEFLKEPYGFVGRVLSLFEKYGIEYYGKTPCRGREDGRILMWKEDEIRLFLFRHPEIEHYCVIDDDDMGPKRSDLNSLRDHLLVTVNYSDNYEEEGLLENHKERIGNILKLEYKLPEEIKKLALQYEERRKQEYGRNL